MNKKFLYLSIAMAMGAHFTSCSDDSDNFDDNGNTTPGSALSVNPRRVFTEGLPAKVDGQPITTDAKGRVTAIGNSLTIQYIDVEAEARSGNNSEYSVILTVDGTEYYGKVNSDGFLTYILREYTESNQYYQEWVISYNSDGQISRLDENFVDYSYKDESSTETYKWYYNNQNLTRMTYTYDSSDPEDDYQVSYSCTDAAHANGIANKGSYIFNQAFDLDDHSLFPVKAYYAGLLGKSTPNLSLKGTWSGEDYEDYYIEFVWNIASSGYPASVRIDDHDDGELSHSYTINYNW